MTKNYQIPTILILLLVSVIFPQDICAQVTAVGSGSYTTVFPGTDSAGRNSFPSGSPQISGNAVGKPVPTNDWWSSLIKENHAGNLFNYPLAMRTVNEGLVVSYIVPTSTPNGSSQPIDDVQPIIVGVTGLNASQATVSDYSDWTVSMNWTNTTHNFKATAGIGMPFLYFTKNTADVARVQINEGTVTISNEMLVVTNSHQGSDYAIYAPLGSTWLQNGNVYTSTLNNKNYWSMAFIPPTATNVTAVANEYKQYAYVFPTNTTAAYSYNAGTAKLTTTFTVATEVKEGTETNVLLGLLPHQWGYLAPGSPMPTAYSYSTIRGELKTLDGNTFTVQNTFKGILPTLPYVDNYSPGFNPAALDSKITQIENDGLAEWTDSYNEGQVMNRLIQTARIANETGDIEARNKIVATIKGRLQDWLKVETGEVAFLFHYNSTWSTLIGYPAGHGQDNNINDHHFHWGYFIHAAAFVEQFEPGWANQWGGMINLLIRDAASPDRNDPLFPYLRNFSPYAGHSWANGFATFPFGNDQESTSESMQFASSLIHWGTITENTTIRDLGIYIYTTEQTATEEYWFDVNERTFKPGYGYNLASRIWGNGYDNQTFWTSDIAAAYGIEMYPIHGGSLYLGHNTAYVQSLWNEIATNTGIMSNAANPNLWHDVYWQYLSFINPQAAINLYDSYPDRALKFGISDAQTYHWLHAMNALGTVNSAITANYPIAASFTKNGQNIYVAHNYSDAPIVVTYSNGFTLNVPANDMVTSIDINATGVLSSNFTQAYANGSVNLTATVTGTGVTKVEFFDGETSLGEDTTAPYGITANNLALGIHSMYARVYVNSLFSVTNIITVQVGEQMPYLNTPFAIPGIIQAGNYDKFEGGLGQNISYNDSSLINEGGYRPGEYVDAAMDNQEGPTVGWIAAGEWMEYTINVQNSGLYNVTLRYASGNTNGGGPFHFELDGNPIGADIAVTPTGNWGTWANKVVSNLPLAQGEHVLRLAVTNGEFNLGAMNFTYSAPLPFVPPIANAGANVVVVLPATTAVLNGSGSNDPGGQPITYNWQQLYGPSTINFSSNTAVSPNISNLAEGIYKCKLTVSDGTYTATDYVMVLVSLTGNSSPSVSITSPQNNTSYVQGTAITINASASDLDGTIANVEFFNGSVSLGIDTTAPYSFDWATPGVGPHTITAIATDNAGAESTSQAVTVIVSGVMQCSEISNVAQQGSFSTGYEATFETVGNNVTITFEMLDTDKVGVVAFLWQQSPFSETQMDNVTGLTFSKTITGLTPGTTISYACKFAYAGGMSVTKYISYVVGENCGGSGTDTQAPTAFTATLGTLTTTSVELLLNATDDSGAVTYTITYNGTTITATGVSGVQKSVIIPGLTPDTAYSFSITASDATGNTAANNPIVVPATTLEDSNSNTECAGTSNTAQQGAFSTGYSYAFETSGTDVTITFEMLDTDKVGVVAFLWQEAPFSEAPMTNISGLTFSKTITGQSLGSTISYACKFAYAGGLSVTQYFTYVVGEDCESGGGTDTQAPTAFTATLGTVTTTSVELLLNATDDSGAVTYTITYNGNTITETGVSGVQKSVIIPGLTPDTTYSFSITASDATGNTAVNNPIVVPATTLEDSNSNTECAGTSNAAQQGAFSTGYSYAFETSGTDVTITFEMLDTDKVGVVAFLWQEAPFSEAPMDNVSGLTFSKTITGQSLGSTISYACKFAYAGGLSVTQYFTYVVGEDCESGGGTDTQAPTAFTATLGTVTTTSVELLLNATDDSGAVTYTITYNGNTITETGASGTQESVVIPGLTPDTVYSFSITASDATGNTAVNNPIVIPATTLEDSNSNTECAGTSNAAQQGAFSTGYSYAFETNGTDVTITFEMLDTDKVGVVAFLWQEAPFSEVPMDNVSGLTFSKTITGQTVGSTISYACKFAYAGGLSVTQYFSYVVGENCDGGSVDTEAPTAFIATLGTVTSTSVELLLNATDDSGTVNYNISYNENTVSETGESGVEKSVVIPGLTPATAYSFSITANDAAGNTAANNPIVLEVTTLDDLSTKDSEFDKSIRLYPNPANSIVTIESTLSAISKVEVYSVLGAKVLESSDTNTISVENLQSGLYLVKIYSGNNHVTKKLMVD